MKFFVWLNSLALAVGALAQNDLPFNPQDGETVRDCPVWMTFCSGIRQNFERTA